MTSEDIKPHAIEGRTKSKTQVIKSVMKLSNIVKTLGDQKQYSRVQQRSKSAVQ